MSDHARSSFTSVAALLGVATVAATVMLVHSAMNTGGFAWSFVAIPTLFGVWMGYQAWQANGRGETESASVILGGAIAAISYISLFSLMAGNSPINCDDTEDGPGAGEVIMGGDGWEELERDQ